MIVDIAGRSIGIFNVENNYHAVRNSCPHRGAPLCMGVVEGFVTGNEPGDFKFDSVGRILRCPWHGWEFNLETGESVFNPHKVWVRRYPVTLEPAEGGEKGDCPEDERVETYPVTIEDSDESGRIIYVHL